MKTTVDLPDALLIEAKKRAVGLRRPLRSLIEAGLRRELEATEAVGPVEGAAIRWVVAAGGLPDGLDLDDREKLGEWMGLSRSV